MVNIAFALKFTTPCKLSSKYGVYHLCFWFPPCLHFFAPYLHRVNLSKSNSSCSVFNIYVAQINNRRIWSSALLLKLNPKLLVRLNSPKDLTVLISISLSFFGEHKNLTAILRIRSAIKILIVSVIDFLTML